MDSTNSEVDDISSEKPNLESSLTTWDETLDFLEKTMRLNNALRGLEITLGRKKQGVRLIHPRFDFNCSPEAYLVSGELDTSIQGFGDASFEAGKKGVSGWFRFSDIEDFIKNKGIIFNGAMFRLGWFYTDHWQPVKRYSDPLLSIWCERRTSECPISDEHPILSLSSNHLERLVVRNVPSISGDNYYFIANRFGKLFFYTKKAEFSAPVSESSDSLIQHAGISSRSFLEPIQKDALLRFENIYLKTKAYSGVAVYLSARRSSNPESKPFYEAILPDNISKVAFQRFASELSGILE